MHILVYLGYLQIFMGRPRNYRVLPRSVPKETGQLSILKGLHPFKTFSLYANDARPKREHDKRKDPREGQKVHRRIPRSANEYECLHNFLTEQ